MDKKLLLSAIVLTTITASAEYLYKPNLNTSQYITGSNIGPIRASCKEILDNGESTGNGIYTINPQGNGDIQIYCDMTTDGGGWTLITHVYDQDNRDDIPNSNMTAGWGNSGNTPSSDTSFNLASGNEPSFTESKWEWQYPLYSETFSHTGNNSLTTNRWTWNYGHSALVQNLDVSTAEEGVKVGVFGWTSNKSLNGIQESCGGGTHYTSGIHYWGYGGVITVNSLSGAELHNLQSGYNRNNGSGVGCGTRQSIFNIYVR